MRSMTKTYFGVAYVVALIVAVLFSITIIGLVFGIPLFMAANKFKAAKDMSDADLVANRSKLLGWGIFTSIALAPTFVGLIIMLSIILRI